MFIAIPEQLYNQIFDDVKIGKDNTVTAVLKKDGKRKKIRGKLIDNGLFNKKKKLSERYATFLICS